MSDECKHQWSVKGYCVVCKVKEEDYLASTMPRDKAHIVIDFHLDADDEVEDSLMLIHTKKGNYISLAGDDTSLMAQLGLADYFRKIVE